MPRPRLLVASAAIVLAAGAIAAAWSSGSVARKPSVRAARPAATGFDVRRAYALTRLQLSYGPRPAGSGAQRRVAARLRRMLPAGHFEAVPGGLRNIVGGLPGRGRAIVVAAHYDTTPVPGYLGANNSATGVGAVVELARDLARDRGGRGSPPVRFVLFDGEEAPAGFVDFYTQGDRGSRAYVLAHLRSTRELVLLDFIALHNELLARETGSNVALWTRLRDAAARVGTQRLFPRATASEVLDDHTPFARAGVAAIDLIDFSYPCWQHVCDNLSQVSERNLGAVGKTVLELVRAERRRLAR